jgi:hypothetical protein
MLIHKKLSTQKAATAAFASIITEIILILNEESRVGLESSGLFWVGSVSPTLGLDVSANVLAFADDVIE